MQAKPKRLKSTASSKKKTSGSKNIKFPIVGIGASAGGLEALEQFLGKVPENSGMAYVVIQHLDPTQKGMLPELLQRVTKMTVFQVRDRMSIKPDSVYVIPPNKSMSVLKGVLHLFKPMETRGLRLPVDFFLRSLADDRREQSIGLVLSGMGSDGSKGLGAIKEKNGIVMVQDPATAKYDSMPRSAMESVVADIIGSPGELPAKLMGFLQHMPIIREKIDIEVKDKSSLDKIIILLRTHTGNDFSLYKKNTVYRRIERRMAVHKIDKISSYVDFLQENPKEAIILFKELMIGVTNFFRDPDVWVKLKETIIPGILSKQMEGTVLRAWVPGCSTGEEAYSLAIVFKEALEKFSPHSNISLQIFATDLDNEAIELARKGTFSPNVVSDVSQERLNRFFIKTDDGFRVNAEIREMVVFALHNIINHPPFTKIDFLSCRNLLIYMDAELQKKLFNLFYYSLNTEGIMLLGSAETLGTQTQLFSPVESKLKIFKRSLGKVVPELFDFPASFSRIRPDGSEKLITARAPQNIQVLADQIILQDFSPAGVLVNENGDIIYISGHTGPYLEPAVGKANLNIFAMLREGLRNEFPSAFRKVLLNQQPVVLRNLKVGSNGNLRTVNLKIHIIDKQGPLNGTVLIVFNDVTEAAENKLHAGKGKETTRSTKQLELQMELHNLREEMQSTLEEMQTSQEELKSTNEELQSTNEELQSTNEELTTSKEEMQSLNEELQTVNSELQSKVDEFSRVNNDMKNLLNSTDIATLFLDKELNIRRFTNQATNIFKLIKSDIGRPFTDLVSDLIYPDLSADALEVLRTLVFIQKQIPTRDGRWYSIRIMPYRTLDDRIDGLVITFINHSDLKHIELKLSETEQMNRLLLHSSSDIVVKLSADSIITEFNGEAEIFFGKKRAEAVNQNFFQMFLPESFRRESEKSVKRLSKEGHDGKVNMHVLSAGGKIKEIECSIHILYDNLKEVAGIIIITKNT